MKQIDRLRNFHSRGQGSGKGGGKGRGQRKGGKGQKQKGKGGRRDSSKRRKRDHCVCPNCGKKAPHQRGVPCSEHRCPSCGSPMSKETDKQNDTSKSSSQKGQRNIDKNSIPEVNKDKCAGCSVCADVCPSSAIAIEDGKAKIQADLCQNCGNCISACPQDAIK